MTRPQWNIDRLLEGSIGQEVRVWAKSFSPEFAGRDQPPRSIAANDLYLPDNTQPGGLPVFFEGRLKRFERRIGVVYVWLESPLIPERPADGTAPFRGSIAVILKGPAVVELAFPFQVERLPLDPDNYWRDLRVPRAQFEFGFSGQVHNGMAPPGGAAGLSAEEGARGAGCCPRANRGKAR